MKMYAKVKEFLCVEMPSEDTKILEFNLYQKADEVLFIIYADHECLMGEIDDCKNNPETLSAIKVGE